MARAVGLDAGEVEVKVVELDGSYRKPRLAKLSIDRVSQTSAVVGDETHAAREADSLDTALTEAGISRENINLGFPSREAVLRAMEVPFTGEEKIRKVIKFEAEREIHGYSVDDMVVDFHVVEELPGDAATRVLVAAVPKAPLRITLEALERANIEPECVDLDAMALLRVAEFAGAFDAAAAADDVDADLDYQSPGSEPQLGGGAAAGATLVMDFGARSVRVLVVVEGKLVDMRTLRTGSDSVAEDVASRCLVTLPEARSAVNHYLLPGRAHAEEKPAKIAAPEQDDDELEDEELLLELDDAETLEDVEADDGDLDDDDLDDDDLDEAERAGPSGLVPVDEVSETQVQRALDSFLQRLRRELLRFVTSVPGLGGIDSVWVTGGAHSLPGVQDLLQDVFDTEPQQLRFMDCLQHDLEDHEVDSLEPRLAVAVGLALGRLGGAQGFNFRQEELVYTRRFDRIKLPLAIACMLTMACLIFWGVNLNKQVGDFESLLGKTAVAAESGDQSRSTGRSGRAAQAQALPQFHGIVGSMINKASGDAWLDQALSDKEYKSLVQEVERAPVFDRVRMVHNRLRSLKVKKERETGYNAALALDSGAGVLQEFAMVLEAADARDQLGRYLIASLELTVPGVGPTGVARGRSLKFRIALSGESEFRSRVDVLQKTIEARFADKRSAFKKFGKQRRETLFRGGRAGAFYDFEIDLKHKIPVAYSPKDAAAQSGAAPGGGR